MNLRTSLLCILLLVAFGCGSEPPPPSDNDTDNGNGDEQTEQENYHDGCPSMVSQGVTCTGSMEGALCEGEEWCDDCEENVAVDCECTPYDQGYRYECTDPCEECGDDEDEQQQNDIDPDDQGPAPDWDPAGSCLTTLDDTGEYFGCSEVEAEQVDDGIEYCEALDEVDDSTSIWQDDRCPNRDEYGSCLDDERRDWDYWSFQDPEEQAISCIEDGGYWFFPGE